MSVLGEEQRRAEEARQRNLPSLYVADRVRMLHDRAAFQIVVRLLAAQRYTKQVERVSTVEVVA